MQREDQLYVKYRVYDEPVEDTEDGHPVRAVAYYYSGYSDRDGEVWLDMKETEGFVFVLKPQTDPAARVALEVYARECRSARPQLADDILGALDLMPHPPGQMRIV